MMVTHPLCFYNKTFTELTSVVHLGKNICGHDGIIHGGLAATILDEMLAYVVKYTAFLLSRHCTANRSYSYRLFQAYQI